MSKQVTMTMYVHVPDGWDKSEYLLFHSDMSNHGYACMGQAEVTFTAPEVDLKAVRLETINKTIESLQREAMELQGSNKESDDE